MFSAFSFGKIIKTILPGSILAAGLILLAEGLWQSTIAPGESLVAKLAVKDWLTAVTAALIPLSLILGFLLNTWVWIYFNARMRAQVDAQLAGTIFPEIRKELSSGLWKSVRSRLAGSAADLAQMKNPTRESLEYFYLPVVSLDRLNYLRESYFSWYEFQINTAFSVLISMPFVAFVLFVKMPGNTAVVAAIVVALAFATYFFFRGLWRAAARNLVEYEKDLMLLIAGSLAHGAPRP
jgi:hypothetical protein